MTAIQLAIASELLGLHDFAMKSESSEVQAFGVLVLGRISSLLAGAKMYNFSETEITDAARMWDDIPGEKPSDGKVWKQ